MSLHLLEINLLMESLTFEIPAPILAIIDIKSVEDLLYLSAMSVRSNWRGSIQCEFWALKMQVAMDSQGKSLILESSVPMYSVSHLNQLCLSIFSSRSFAVSLNKIPQNWIYFLNFINQIEWMNIRDTTCFHSWGNVRFYTLTCCFQRVICITVYSLAIETGRYCKPTIPANERFCKACKDKAEDELHFLIVSHI